MRVTIEPHQKGNRGVLCLPMVKNVPDADKMHPDWKKIRCPICGVECWQTEGHRKFAESEPELIQACTMCGIKAGMMPHEVTMQPELPIMKNNEQRKAFLETFHDWPVWFEVPEAAEIYYRYNLSDGHSIVIQEYNSYCEWMEKYDDMDAERLNTVWHLLKPGYHYLHDCQSSKTAIIEHLKKMKKGA